MLCGINRGGFVYARLPSRLRDVFRINVKTNEIVVPHNLAYLVGSQINLSPGFHTVKNILLQHRYSKIFCVLE